MSINKYSIRFKTNTPEKSQSLSESLYPMCACGVVPDWYCKMWSDRPLSMCKKEETNENSD